MQLYKTAYFATWYCKLVFLNHIISLHLINYYSLYFPTAANEPEISHINKKQLTSELKNKVDVFRSITYLLSSL